MRDIKTRAAMEQPKTRQQNAIPRTAVRILQRHYVQQKQERQTQHQRQPVEYATEQLLQYDNVKVHCFLIDYNTILTLAQYADHVHASTLVTERMTQYLLEGKFRFTEENYQLRLDELREFVANYDYDKVFESLW